MSARQSKGGAGAVGQGFLQIAGQVLKKRLKQVIILWARRARGGIYDGSQRKMDAERRVRQHGICRRRAVLQLSRPHGERSHRGSFQGHQREGSPLGGGEGLELVPSF